MPVYNPIAPTIGQKTMAGSEPVVLASDQSTLPTLDTNSAAILADLISLLAGLVAQGSTTSGQSGPLAQGAVSTSSPSYTNGQTSPLSLTPSGGLRSAQSGTWTMQPGNTANTTAWLMKLLGATTAFIAAGTSANTVVKNSAGTFYGIFASTIGAGGGLVYDNASTNSGTPVGVAPTAVGFDTGVPEVGVACVNGITVAGGVTNPALTVFYI